MCRMTPSDLRFSIDLSDTGLGHTDVRWVLNRFVLWETAMICGEIAAKPVEPHRAAATRRANATHSLQSA